MADIDNLSIRISTTTGKAVSNVNKLVEALKNLNAQLDRIDPSRMQSCAQAAKDLGSAVQSVSSSKKALADVSDAAKSLGDAIKGANDKINESGRVAGSSGASGAKEFANSVEKIGSAMLKSGWSGFTSTLKKAGSLFASIGKGALKAAKNIGHFGKSSHSAKGSLSKLVKELTRVGKMLKLMITRMVLRQVISGIGDGFKNLAQYSKSFDATLSTLWNSFRQLGNAIAAAASPLLTAFAPALNYIIQLAIKAVNAINQLVSALTGLGTWKKAKTLTDSYAASLDKTNKSAKELKKTVLGFDELNQLQDNSNSGGGGASPADMFEESPISDKWKNWADKLKDMWAKADFTELGRILGEKLRDALENIPWDKIKNTARKLGSSLATLINGFVETERLGYDIGKTLAESINTAFEFLNEYVHKLHWASIGKFIAETFNGFFENIDWGKIKDTVVTGLKGVATSIWSFITTFKWDNISETIVNAFDTISAGIKAFFEQEGYDERGFKLNGTWAQRLGRELGAQLKKAIKEIPWKQVGEAIGDIVQAAIDFAAELLEGLEWSDVKKALQELIEGFFNKVDKNALGKVIGGVLAAAIVVGIGKIGLTVAGIALTAKIKALVTGSVASATAASATDATVASAATTAGTSIGSILGGALAVAATAVVGQQVGTQLGKNVFFPEDAELYEQYEGISGFFKELKDLGVATADYVKMAWSGDIAENNFYSSLSREEQEYFQALQVHYGKDFHDIALDQLGVFTSYADAWKQLKGEAKGYYDEVHDKLNKLSAEADKTKEVTSKIYDSKAAESFKNMNERAAELKDTLTHIQDTKAAEHFKTMTDNMSKNTQSVKDFGTEVQKTTESISTSTQKITEEIPTEVATSLTEVSTSVTECETTVSGSMENVKKVVDDGMLSINESLDKVKSGLTKEEWTFDGVAEGLKETFRRAKEGIKSEWNQIANTLNGNHTVGTSSININLPKFANGGFPEDGLLLANHGEMAGKFSNGKSVVANNEQITNGIAQAVFNAITSANGMGGGDRYINNTIVVDGEVLARTVTKGQDRLNRRYSPTMA